MYVTNIPHQRFRSQILFNDYTIQVSYDNGKYTPVTLIIIYYNITFKNFVVTDQIMDKYKETKSEPNTSSVSSRTFTALVISVSMLSAAVILSTMTNDSFAQGSNANNNNTSSSSSVGQGTAAAGLSLNCQSIASTMGGIVVPNPSKICDVLIPRQAPTIMGPGNMNMNKFSLANSIVEVASISDVMATTNRGGGGGASGGSSNGTAARGGGGASGPASSGTGNQNVFVMGEFALLEPQLVPMVKAAVGSNWTIAAVHNHMVLEKPKMMLCTGRLKEI
jgi:uncharacterized protein DUF1259